MAPLNGRPASGPDPHDISIVLPGSLMVRLLSRHPLRGDAATRGLIVREFRDGDTMYSSYVGLAKKPTGNDPYIRFITVVGKSRTGTHPTEGVYIHGDPFDMSPTGNRTVEMILRKITSEDTLPIVKSCYRVVAGIYKMISDLNMLSGGQFKPIQKIGKALSLHGAKIMLRAFLRDPVNGGADALREVLDEIKPHSSDDVTSLSFSPIREGLYLIEYDGFKLHGRPGAKVPACYSSGITVGLQQFVPTGIGRDSAEITLGKSGFEIEPGIALHIVELIKCLPLVGAYKMFAISKHSSEPHSDSDLEESLVFFPYGPLKKLEGLYLSKEMLSFMVLDLIEHYDPPWYEGGVLLLGLAK
jgi:hypothetical protein